MIGLIKNSKIPIICMCNDRNHQKIRSLANYCFDLRFQRPRVEQIKVHTHKPMHTNIKSYVFQHILAFIKIESISMLFLEAKHK